MRTRIIGKMEKTGFKVRIMWFHPGNYMDHFYVAECYFRGRLKERRLHNNKNEIYQVYGDYFGAEEMTKLTFPMEPRTITKSYM